MTTPRLTGGQIVTIAVAVCAAVVLAPVGVMAATGQLVNIADPVNSAARAHVDTGGKLRVGDGGGAITVDGTVSTRSDNALLYQSPAAGLECGADAAGIVVPMPSLAPYRRIRIMVRSGPSNQTIISLLAKTSTQVVTSPAFVDWTVPAGQSAQSVYDAPPTAVEARIYFCASARVLVYGIR